MYSVRSRSSLTPHNSAALTQTAMTVILRRCSSEPTSSCEHQSHSEQNSLGQQAHCSTSDIHLQSSKLQTKQATHTHTHTWTMSPMLKVFLKHPVTKPACFISLSSSCVGERNFCTPPCSGHFFRQCGTSGWLSEIRSPAWPVSGWMGGSQLHLAPLLAACVASCFRAASCTNTGAVPFRLCLNWLFLVLAIATRLTLAAPKFEFIMQI